MVRNGCEFCRDLVADDQAGAPFHQEKRRAEDGGVLANQIDSGSFGEVRMNRMENFVFPGHVVGFGSHRTERRPAQHVFASRGFDKVNEIGMAARKLGDADICCRPGEVLAQVFRERVQVQFFACADGGGIVTH